MRQKAIQVPILRLLKFQFGATTLWVSFVELKSSTQHGDLNFRRMHTGGFDRHARVL